VDAIFGYMCLESRDFDEKQILHHLLQIRTNSFAISKMTNSFTESNSEVASISQVRVGLSIYPCGSRLNHSCQSNTITNFGENLELTIRATEKIKSGDQVFTNYGPDHVRIRDKAKRQEILKQKFFFVCECRACANISVNSSEFLEENIQTMSVEKIIEEGEKLMQQQKYPLAINLFNQALEVALKSGLPPHHRLNAIIHDNIAQTYAKKGDLGLAANHVALAISVLEIIFGENSVEVGHEYVKLARLLFNRKTTSKALSAIKKASDILDVHYGPDDEVVRELKAMTCSIQTYTKK